MASAAERQDPLLRAAWTYGASAPGGEMGSGPSLEDGPFNCLLSSYRLEEGERGAQGKHAQHGEAPQGRNLYLFALCFLCTKAP